MLLGGGAAQMGEASAGAGRSGDDFQLANIGCEFVDLSLEQPFEVELVVVGRAGIEFTDREGPDGPPPEPARGDPGWVARPD
ncbi:MAG: hypothetical protein WAL63_06085 [Solirubrobacteraceae bacterium]